MNKIILIGKKGCLKCSKMNMILTSRGIDVESIYVESAGKIKIGENEINIEAGTHFPLYLYNDVVYHDYKGLIEVLN